MIGRYVSNEDLRFFLSNGIIQIIRFFTAKQLRNRRSSGAHGGASGGTGGGAGGNVGGAGDNIAPRRRRRQHRRTGGTSATSAAQGGGDVGDARGQTKRENDFRTMESAITYDTIICPCFKCSTLLNMLLRSTIAARIS